MPWLVSRHFLLQSLDRDNRRLTGRVYSALAPVMTLLLAEQTRVLVFPTTSEGPEPSHFTDGQMGSAEWSHLVSKSPTVAVTSYPKHSGVKRVCINSLTALQARNLKRVSFDPNHSQWWPGHDPSKGSKGKSISLLFAASGGWPHPLVHAPPITSSFLPLLPLPPSSFSAICFPSVSLLQGPVWLHWGPPDNPGWSPKILNLNHISRDPLPCVTIHRLQGWGCGHLGGGHYSATTVTEATRSVSNRVQTHFASECKTHDLSLQKSFIT